MALGDSWEWKEKCPDPFLPQESQHAAASQPESRAAANQQGAGHTSLQRMWHKGTAQEGQPGVPWNGRKTAPNFLGLCCTVFLSKSWASLFFWIISHKLLHGTVEVFPLEISQHFQAVTHIMAGPRDWHLSVLHQRGEKLSVSSSSSGNVGLKSTPSPPVPVSPLPGKRLPKSRCRSCSSCASWSSHGDDSPGSHCYGFYLLRGGS